MTSNIKGISSFALCSQDWRLRFGFMFALYRRHYLARSCSRRRTSFWQVPAPLQHVQVKTFCACDYTFSFTFNICFGKRFALQHWHLSSPGSAHTEEWYLCRSIHPSMCMLVFLNYWACFHRSVNLYKQLAMMCVDYVYRKLGVCQCLLAGTDLVPLREACLSSFPGELKVYLWDYRGFTAQGRP